MEKAKVYYSDLRTSPTSNLLDKMERLLKRAGIEQLPLKDSFAAIKIHFGEPGNLAYLRPNYAARMATLLRSLGAKPFLTDCNTLYSGRRANAVDLYSPCCSWQETSPCRNSAIWSQQAVRRCFPSISLH